MKKSNVKKNTRFCDLMYLLCKTQPNLHAFHAAKPGNFHVIPSLPVVTDNYVSIARTVWVVWLSKN